MCGERNEGDHQRLRGLSAGPILKGRAHSVPRATHAERFELFAPFVRLPAGHVVADGLAGLTRLCQGSMPSSAGPGTGSSLSRPWPSGLPCGNVAGPDERPCPRLGSVARLGVQTSWKPRDGAGARAPRTSRRTVRCRRSPPMTGCGAKQPRHLTGPGDVWHHSGQSDDRLRPPLDPLVVDPDGLCPDQPGQAGELFRSVAAASTASRLRARGADQPLGHRGAGVGLRGRRAHPPGTVVGRSRRSR